MFDIFSSFFAERKLIKTVHTMRTSHLLGQYSTSFAKLTDLSSATKIKYTGYKDKTCLNKYLFKACIRYPVRHDVQSLLTLIQSLEE